MKYACPQDFPTKLHLTLRLLTGALLAFTLVRLALWLMYRPVFAALSPGQTAMAFVQGLRFDFSVLALFLGPGVFLLFLPVRSVKWAKGCYILLITLLLFLLMVLAGDFIYFPQAKRHMAEELLHVKNEWAFLLHFAVVNCWPYLLAAALLYIGLLRTGLRYLRRHWRPAATAAWRTGAACVLILLIVLLGIRGKLGEGKPLSMTDIHRYSSAPAQATLMINGVFSSYHSLRRGETAPANPTDKEWALAQARSLFASPQETFVRADYPLLRQVKTTAPFRAKNVLVVLLESWTPKYVDSFGQGHYQVTPHFDELARQGVRFSQAYASGVRSIFGISAAFAGVPLIPGLPHFAYGLELNQITSLAQALKHQGYYTAFIQSSLRSSYQMCNISQKIFGVDESFGMEDIPRLMNYRAEQDFGYDYDLLQFAAGKADAAHRAGKPFFLFTFTGTTHVPFRQTTPEFDKYPRTSEENKYLNSLYYADYAIGQLMQRARQGGWLKDTVFVFMADHTMATAQKDDELLTKFRIPFVIYAPGLLAPQQIDYPVSQLDLIPTLYHLLQIPAPFAALGADALNPAIQHFAFISESTNLAFIDPTGHIRHNRLQPLEISAAPGTPQHQALQERLLALDKSVQVLFENNRWFTPTLPQK